MEQAYVVRIHHHL